MDNLLTWQSICDWFGVDSAKSRHLVSCPAHDDAAPSLSIRQTQAGKVLIHCFAGCSFGAVLAALRNGSRPEPPTRVAESSRISRDWPSLLLKLDRKKDKAIARHLCRRIGTGTIEGYLNLFPQLRLIPSALGIPAIAVYDEMLGGQAMPLFAEAFKSAKTGKTYKKYTLPGTNCKIPLFFNQVKGLKDYMITEGISDWLALASQVVDRKKAYLPMLGAAHNLDSHVAAVLRMQRTYCLFDADKAGEAGFKKLQMLTGCIRLAPPDDFKDWRSYLIAHHPSDF